MENELTYRDIRILHQTERNKQHMNEIRPDFYIKAREYLKKLEDNLKNEKDEYKKKIIADEIKSAKQIIQDIYKLREKKIVLAALSKVRGGKPDTKFFLESEKELFDEIVKCLQKYREIMLEGKKEEKRTKEVEKKKEKKYIALIKQEIPKFVGPDMRTYILRKDDIVCLPETIFNILVKRGVAEKVI